MGEKIKNQGYNVRGNYLKLVYTNCWGGGGCGLGGEGKSKELF